MRSAGSSTYNYANPVRRDVVSIGGAGDNVTIRFRTDNAGPWIMHWCVLLSAFAGFHSLTSRHSHIDWHLDLGFAVVLAEDIPGIKPTNPVPRT